MNFGHNLKNKNMALPDWVLLKNEIGTNFNNFCILRGKEFITLGEDVWVGYFTLIDGSGGLEIGNKVSISSGVHIYTHDSSNYRLYNTEKDLVSGSHIDRAPVKIGNNVQIGANSVILKGVTIGNNVVIGALSLVNKDIPDNCIAVGNPCKIIKQL
jgi:acetyltransferase-like isoleucine patch superfamily enzyme